MYKKQKLNQKRKRSTITGCNRNPAGYTIVELIVVMGILGLLFAISLPAVQSARTSARKLQCLNNLRNISLGIIQLTDSANRFPACGYYGDGTPATVGTYRSWVVDVLPYLDRANIYDKWDFDVRYTNPINEPLASTHIPVITCPDDVTVITGFGNQSYVLSSGVGFTAQIGGVHDCPVGPNSGKLDLNGNGITCNSSTKGDGASPTDREIFLQMGLFFNETWKGEKRAVRHHTMASLTDGVSNTMLISESIRTGYDPDKPTSNWASPNPYLTSFYIGNPCLGAKCVSGNVDYNRANSGSSAINAGIKRPEGSAPYPSSLHKGGVNVGYCDGRIEFMSENIDGKVYAALASPQGAALAGTPLEQ